jgi:hypothetical protein
VQAVADAYDDTIQRYLAWQDALFAAGRLEGYELKTYLRRRRQSLLWKILERDVVEELPAFAEEPRAGLEAGIVAATGAKPAVVSEEVERLLALGALVPRREPGGVRYVWSEGA